MITINKGWLKITFAVAICFVIILLIMNKQLIPVFMAGDLEQFISSVNEQFLPMFIITFILMIIHNVITVIPLILILTVNISFYGFVCGLIWSWLVSILGATLIFVGARYFFRDFLEKRISDSVKSKAEENGFMYVLLARIFPFVPTNLVNIISGVSSIRFKDFFIATSIGNLIYFFTLSLVPLGLASGNSDLIILISVFLIVAAFLYKRRKQKTEDNLKKKQLV
ncbi:TVP38/TMEM64 family protein [Anaerobacillus sp. CMMVII]|uniref:TVP38/TMEM64 family protein n=1 Tax=Anaerobacillus sp. CMMVII TaxID=2755588 RepID=UPI0021B79DDA|nr:VTT domain-containing protein [Anaerobacillus sp. CMMVII]MCT8138241.1 TVP38/TMEM64 family protein [Anaerobacillus sp. CMMVII]